MDKILKNWKNPVFEPTEPPIPRSYNEDDPTGTKPSQATCGPGLPSIPVQSHVSRDSLKKAQVISQVDKKFILARIPSSSSPSSSSILLLIDQHAADERIRLEALTSTYFSSPPSQRTTANADPLPSPIQFEVPRREGKLLLRFQRHLSYWGILYNVDPSATAGADPQAKITVLSLPPGIIERCRQEPRLLIDLLRTEIWKLDDRPPPPPPTHRRAGVEGQNEWVSMFGSCPRGIMDLLNSRACRSMFSPPPPPPHLPSSFFFFFFFFFFFILIFSL